MRCNMTRGREASVPVTCRKAECLAPKPHMLLGLCKLENNIDDMPKLPKNN